MIKNQSGQSLLEVTLALGILVIILGAMTIVTVNGLRNSQSSKNQAQATKLAQEGLDAVKTIKSHNCPVNIGGAYYWSNVVVYPQQIWGNNFGTAIVRANLVAPYDAPTHCSLNTAGTETINQFQRTITLEYLSATEGVRVSSLVEWIDTSGAHNSNLVTILTNH